MSNPLVSVLMPVRDGAATIDDALQSIRAQTLVEHEVVAVDDGSVDATAARLAEQARRDPRLRVLHTPASGIVQALNFGLAHCRAPVVARLDADDRMAPQRLALQHLAFQRWPRAAVVGSRVELFPRDAVRGGMAEYVRWQDACISPAAIAADIYVEAPFAHPSVALRRDALAAVGNYAEGVFPEDYELWLRFARDGYELRKLGGRLTAWRQGAGSLSRRDPRCARSAFDALRARYLASDRRLAGRPIVVWGAGRRTRQRFRSLADHGVAVQAWIDIDPAKIGNIINGAPVVPPVWLRRRATRPMVLVYVANHGARDAIARYLDAVGYRRGVDYLRVG